MAIGLVIEEILSIMFIFFLQQATLIFYLTFPNLTFIYTFLDKLLNIVSADKKIWILLTRKRFQSSPAFLKSLHLEDVGELWNFFL